MAQQFVTSSSAAVGPRIQEIDQTGTMVQRPVAYWRHVSWGAIFAGSVLAIATQMLLMLLGAGIGLLVLGGGTEPTATGFGIAAGIWWLVVGVVSLFIGGAVAGRLSRVSQATDGVFHGLLVWAVTTLFSIWVLTTAAANLAGGMFAALNTWIDAGQPGAAAQTAPAAPGERVGAQVAPGEGPGAAAADDPARVGGFDGQANGVLPRIDEATARDAAADAGQAALWSFFALTLGAVAAGWGGSAGRRMFSRWDEPTTIVSRTTTTPSQQPPPAPNEGNPNP